MDFSRSMVQRVVLGLLVAWLAWAAGVEAFVALDRSWWHPPHERPPGVWRFSTPPPERLDWWLERVRQVVPPGSRVAFSSPRNRGDAPLFRLWWATYWMPEYTMIPAHPPGFEPRALPVDFHVTYGLRLDDPSLELVLEEWAGAVYRRRESR